MGSAHETENKVRLGLPRIIQRKENAPEFDYSSFYVTTGMGHTGCLVAQDSALLTKVRTLIHEEISLLTVLYFPFRARTPVTQRLLRASDATPGTGEHPLTAPM